jgi:hypothetical protein
MKPNQITRTLPQAIILQKGRYDKQFPYTTNPLWNDNLEYTNERLLQWCITNKKWTPISISLLLGAGRGSRKTEVQPFYDP